jgi:hypothetical protein
MLKVSKLSAASRTAARAWAPSCTRPTACRKRSSKLCTPMDSRVTPAARKARKRSVSKVPGLASMVISQSASMRSRARRAASSRSMDSGANRLGVPPPMKMLCTVRPQIRGSALSRSATRASM